MSESIEDDELLYRRIPASTGWYSAETGEIKPDAFAPHKINDFAGLSLSRAKFKSVAQAAHGQPGDPIMSPSFRQVSYAPTASL